MADLALLIFHFGKCSSFFTNQTKFFITIHLSTYTTSLSSSSSASLSSSFMPLNFLSPLLSSPPSAHFSTLDLFHCLLIFQQVSALLGSTQWRMAEGGWPETLWLRFEPATPRCTWALPASPPNPPSLELHTRLLPRPADTAACSAFFTPSSPLFFPGVFQSPA